MQSWEICNLEKGVVVPLKKQQSCVYVTTKNLSQNNWILWNMTYENVSLWNFSTLYNLMGISTKNECRQFLVLFIKFWLFKIYIQWNPLYYIHYHQMFMWYYSIRMIWFHFTEMDGLPWCQYKMWIIVVSYTVSLAWRSSGGHTWATWIRPVTRRPSIRTDHRLAGHRHMTFIIYIIYIYILYSIGSEV